MEIKEILYRVGYVRNCANLSARELSFRIGMSAQYIAQVESGRIVLTVEKLLMILEVCHFPLERFFAPDIQDWKINTDLQNFFANLSSTKKRNIVELLIELRSS
ncbi:MAG: helix-turn-helix domain-containing protein [Clostridia bacterium]|nr:helix-turn-helix domain-containing protein [Clostridia bacterium]